jgi:SAM-dependent methyltransferase
MISLHRRNLRFQKLLCCPGTGADVVFKATTVDVDGCVKEGWILSEQTSAVVGLIKNYKWDFVNFDPEPENLRAQRTRTFRRLDSALTEFTITPFDSDVEKSGVWQSVVPAFEKSSGEVVFSNGNKDDTLEFSGEFTDISVRLYYCAWGGIADIFVDGDHVTTIDTYIPRWGRTKYVEIARNLPLGRHKVTLRATGQRSPDARGAQVFVRELIVTAPLGAFAGRERPIPLELCRTNRHDHRLTAVRLAAPATGYVLEVGGGDRFIDAENYLNTEYADQELPGVFCDTLALPFKTDSFDAVVSQAVLEHVRDPRRMADEIERVTKPGGTIWVGAAFMQPVHLEPYHFFNATPHGMTELFGGLENFEMEYNGNLAATVDWMIDCLPEPERFSSHREKVEAILKDIEKLVPQQEMSKIASGVLVKGRKRVG